MVPLALLSIGLLLVSWGLYPLVVWLLGKGAPRLEPRRPPYPSLGALVVTRDSPEVVAAKVRNLMGCRGCTLDEILVVLDWNARDRLTEMQQAVGGDARVLLGDDPGGKAAGLNKGMEELSTDWVLLADSWQQFDPEAVRMLMEAMGQDTYAAVSGRVIHQHDDPVMALYWRFENGLRSSQAALHSVVTTSGAICLLDRTHWNPLPAGTICDDLFMTMDLVASGFRVGYEPGAVAVDPRNLSRKQLFQKKVRTLTGLWQLLRWRPEVLIPARNPVWLHFVLHKLARLMTPYLVALAGAGWVYHLAQGLSRPDPAVVGFLALGMALLALLRPRLVRAGWQGLVWAISLLAAPLLATYHGLRADWGVWREHTAEESV